MYVRVRERERERRRRDIVAGADGKTSPAISLVAGGIAGGVESACTYPFEFAKTRVRSAGLSVGSVSGL